MLAINLAFFVAEVVGGYLANSLALLSDAGHMFTDVAALGLAIVASRLAERAPTRRRTYGLLKAEAMGAFINGGTLALIVAVILWEAYRRLREPVAVNGPVVLLIAAAGLLANAGSMLVIFGRRNQDLNTRGVFLHMLGDTLGSIGALVAGAVIWITGWTPIDPLVSILIGGIIFWTSLSLLRSTLDVLLDAVPSHIRFEHVEEALKSIGHVQNVHDLHIRTLGTGIATLSAHLTLKADCCDSAHWHQCLGEAQTMLAEKFGITHSTLQVEPPGYEKDPREF